MKKLLLGSLIALGAFVVSLILMNPFSFIRADRDLPAYDDEPDMPGFLQQAKNKFSKEEFMLKRSEGVAMKRGIYKDLPFDPKMRPAAIRKMEEQENLLARLPESEKRDSLLAAWTPLGPAPIPNGQTSPSAPVSGRVISIEIHPTNPNIVYVGTAQGGVYRTTDGGTNWTPIFDSADSLAVGAIAIAPSQPETVYVGTGEPNFSSDSYFGAGLYRIDNASTTANLTGPLGASSFTGNSISEIIVHPTDPDTIFVSSTSGLGGIRGAGIATPNRGLYRSTNATSGAPTFSQIGFGGSFSVRDIAIDPNNPNILVMSLIAGGGGLYRLTDALAATPTTFTQVQVFTCTSTSNCNAELTSQKSGGATDATFYAATGDGNGRVLISTDGGATWTQQIDNNFCGGQCFYDIAVAVDPTNPANVYVGGDPTIIAARSTNSGLSFTDNNASVHADTHAIEVAPSDPTQVWLGTDGGIYKSTNSGVTWTPMNNSQFSATQFMSIAIHPTDPNFSIGGTQDNGTNFYQPAGTWTRADFGDGGYSQIDQNAPDTTNVRMYHTYFNASNLQGYGTVSSTASASSGLWSFRGCQSGGATTNGITCNGTVNFYAPLERGPGNPNTIYYGTDRLYRSADTGLNHTVVSQNPIESGVPISSIGISPQDDNVRIVGLNSGGIYGTSTGSTTLTNLDPGNTVPTAPIARTVIDPTNSDTAYVTLSAFGVSNVWKTTNLSSLTSNLVPTWTNASGTGLTALPQVPVNSIVIDPTLPNNIYVGTDIGVYVSSDGGANWAPFGTGLPRVAVFGIGIAPGTTRQIRIATHGRGLFQIPALLAPTAASATVKGRIFSTNGSGVNGAIVTFTNSLGEIRSARTNSFGYYNFEDVPVGETYTFNVRHKAYQFTPQAVTINQDVKDLDFTAVP
ncbi:MAG: carboxypeptidase regulatory-like domain-containing protein [Pyrinomonadaceae bacterium]